MAATTGPLLAMLLVTGFRDNTSSEDQALGILRAIVGLSLMVVVLVLALKRVPSIFGAIATVGMGVATIGSLLMSAEQLAPLGGGEVSEYQQEAATMAIVRTLFLAAGALAAMLGWALSWAEEDAIS